MFLKLVSQNIHIEIGLGDVAEKGSISVDNNNYTDKFALDLWSFMFISGQIFGLKSRQFLNWSGKPEFKRCAVFGERCIHYIEHLSNFCYSFITENYIAKNIILVFSPSPTLKWTKKQFLEAQ